MKTWVHEHIWLSISVAFIVGVLTGVGAGNTPVEESETASETEQTEASDTETETTEPPPEPDPEPDATFSQTCDYLLGDTYRFIGTSQVRNTGNIGAIVRVTFLWYQAGTSPIKEQRVVRVPVGRGKTVNVDLLATSDNISRLQALPIDQQCRVKANLFDTFGEPVD